MNTIDQLSALNGHRSLSSSNMKGLILAGGRGTRLRPLTHTNAKQLVPIANKPILFYGIEELANAGITDIGIVIGETGDEIRKAVGDGSRWGVNIVYIPQNEPLGLAHCVIIAQSFLKDDDFIMYLGDNMLEQKLSPIVQRFSQSRIDNIVDCRILLKEVANPSMFGVAELSEDGSVKTLVEKPTDPPSNLALVGVYMFSSNIHTAVNSITPSSRGELEITDAIQWQIDQGLKVDHDILDGWWIDTGKKDPLLECNRLVLSAITSDLDPHPGLKQDSVISGTVQIDANSTIANCTIIGPVVIGENVSIENSSIGPYVSVGNNCSLSNATIENSVLLSNCSIVGGGRIESSLLGRSSHVSGNPSLGSSTLMLGDDSVVELN